MSDFGWLIAGGAAVTGVLGVFWGYVRLLWTQLASRIIVSCELRNGLAEPVGMYFWQHFKASCFGFRTYTGETMYVRPVKRVQLVAMEVVGHAGRLYWRGWRPLWLSRIQSNDKGGMHIGTQYSAGGLRLTFIRGTFNIEHLLIEATTCYNHFLTDTSGKVRSRYHVKHAFGTANKPAKMQNDGAPTACCNDVDPATLSLTHRALQWSLNDLGTSNINHGTAIAQQALRPDAKDMVEEIRRWMTSEEWYKARGIPWRRGWLLHGAPGTGKTSLIRAVAEDFDLPVYVFDLATLFNDELQRYWQMMLTETPCIALIEDIDAVFDIRENKVGGHLTFDCLLNCLDGVERTDGVLLMITTNHLEKLDPALATRPGRIDRALELCSLDVNGRRHLCQRILCERPEIWEETIRQGEGETGAQFQERCTQLALAKYWESAPR